MNIKKILTVDDYPLAAYTTKKTIQAFSSHKCEIEDFENPLILLEVFKQDPESIDMVVTDYEMPELRGDELIKELRKIKPNIKVVVISAWLDSVRGDDEHLIEKEVKELNPNYILSKPFPDNWIDKLDDILAE
jgi:CheY-like chemotaxis protein